MPVTQISVIPVSENSSTEDSAKQSGGKESQKTKESGRKKSGKDEEAPPVMAAAVEGGRNDTPLRDQSQRCQSAASVLSTNANICRICHCEEDTGMLGNAGHLITPCYCSGSLKYIHQHCLQLWIKSSDTKQCELCNYRFNMESQLKPLGKWEKLHMTPNERRKIICSVTFHIIAITCVVWSLYVLIDRTTEEIQSGKLEWPFWTKLVVVAIGFTGGLVFMYVQCKVYVQLWRRLKAYNRVIYIRNCPEGDRSRRRKGFRGAVVAQRVDSPHAQIELVTASHSTQQLVQVEGNI